MKSTELFKEIGSIDQKLIEEAMIFSASENQQFLDSKRISPLFSGKKGRMIAAAALAVMIAAFAFPGEITSLASKINSYLSGIVKTPDDSVDLGAARSLNTGRVQGLDENLCKYYTSFQALEDDLGLDLLEYSEPYRLALGSGPRPISLQYFDYNESASISVSVAYNDAGGRPVYMSYDMDFLTGSDGYLGAFGVVGKETEMEMETFCHPALDIPVALITSSGGGVFACFIYENVRYIVIGGRDVNQVKEFAGQLQ